MKYAIIENNRVQDISHNPSECFHPDVAKLYDTEVPDDVQVGYELIDGVWTAPVIPEPDPNYVPPEPKVSYAKVSPVEFKMLFTSSERIAIKALKETDEIIADFYEIVEDPRLTVVDFTLQSVRDAIDYMVSKNVITADRALEIKTGTSI